MKFKEKVTKEGRIVIKYREHWYNRWRYITYSSIYGSIDYSTEPVECETIEEVKDLIEKFKDVWMIKN